MTAGRKRGRAAPASLTRREESPARDGKGAPVPANATVGVNYLFDLLVEQVLDYGICVVDPAGRVATWNRGAQRIKGYEPHEIIGQPYGIFFTEEDRRRADELIHADAPTAGPGEPPMEFFDPVASRAPTSAIVDQARGLVTTAMG